MQIIVPGESGNCDESQRAPQKCGQLTPIPRAASKEVGAPECDEDQRAGHKA
jgi:hypothetical protein